MSLLTTLVRLLGDGCIIFGIILTMLGVIGLAFTTYSPNFYIGGRPVTPQEGGQMTSIAGIILLVVGIVITYIRRSKIIVNI